MFNYYLSSKIYTLSLHDALPILQRYAGQRDGVALWSLSASGGACGAGGWVRICYNHPEIVQIPVGSDPDRKSTRLNSSHRCISYAVFCLKKKIRYQKNNNTK